MQFPILTTLAVLAWAGAALAQPPSIPIASDFEGGTSTPTAHEQVRSRAPERAASVLRSVEKASSRMRLACAAERRTFCADQTSALAADHCVQRHESELTSPCRSAIAEARGAWDRPY